MKPGNGHKAPNGKGGGEAGSNAAVWAADSRSEHQPSGTISISPILLSSAVGGRTH